MRWDVMKGPMWDSDLQEQYEESLPEDFEEPEEMRDGENRKYKDGDYIYSDEVQGVFWKGGVVVDGHDEEDIADEWKNEILRDSLAKSSLVKVRKQSSGTFFTKGKLNEIGLFVEENDVDVVFVNTTLTPLQQKKLEKRLNDYVLNRTERLRRYFLRSSQTEAGEPTDIDSSSGYVTGENSEVTGPEREIKVIDRFTMILLIFAARARSPLSRAQIELAWLDFSRARMRRGDNQTLQKMGSIFSIDSFFNDATEVEIVSYRARGGIGQVQGAGETQLEIESRIIDQKKAQLRKQIEAHNLSADNEREKRAQ